MFSFQMAIPKKAHYATNTRNHESVQALRIEHTEAQAAGISNQSCYDPFITAETHLNSKCFR
jgi:hypothetical protein